MRHVFGLAALTISLVPAPAAAQQTKAAVPPEPAPQRAQLAGPEVRLDTQPQKGPYARLFTAPEIEIQPQRQEPQVQPQPKSPRVVCGMTVIQADPSVDPRMVIPRVDDGPRHAIRTITPPVCRE